MNLCQKCSDSHFQLALGTHGVDPNARDKWGITEQFYADLDDLDLDNLVRADRLKDGHLVRDYMPRAEIAKIAVREVKVVPDSECEFWAHASLREATRQVTGKARK